MREAPRSNSREIAYRPARVLMQDFTGADGFCVLDGYAAAVLVAQQVLQQDLERERQARDVAETGRRPRQIVYS